MKKIILVLILGFLLTYIIPGVPSYTEEEIRIYVNGHHLPMEMEPVIENGRTLVPVRKVFQIFGAEIFWDGENRIVTGEFPETTIRLQIDNDRAFVDEEEHILQVSARIIQDRSYVPVRFIAESLGAEVGWDGENQIVHLDSDSVNYHGEYRVKRVVDGDTILVDYRGQEETVRLIGVDTPESVHPDQEKNTESGEIASDYTKEALTGKHVGIQLDIQERDQYGRLLAYVWLEGELFNKTLLEEGYAAVATYPPNVIYEEIFREAQEEARDQRRGFWNDVF